MAAVDAVDLEKARQLVDVLGLLAVRDLVAATATVYPGSLSPHARLLKQAFAEYGDDPGKWPHPGEATLAGGE